MKVYAQIQSSELDGYERSTLLLMPRACFPREAPGCITWLRQLRNQTSILPGTVTKTKAYQSILRCYGQGSRLMIMYLVRSDFVGLQMVDDSSVPKLWTYFCLFQHDLTLHYRCK